MIFLYVLVRPSDLYFIRLNVPMHSVWILKWYWLSLRFFLCLLWEATPTTLGSRHRCCAYDHECHLLCVEEITDRRRIDVSRTRCLMTTMRLSLHCIYFIGPIRRSVCDTVVSRATVRDTAYGKPRGVTKLSWNIFVKNFLPIRRSYVTNTLS